MGRGEVAADTIIFKREMWGKERKIKIHDTCGGEGFQEE
jgi:hypothetical protein